ncbi:histidine transporter [Advenella kashmirensis W13003]|uniref:Histidine transporter n=1 Tax=Advenella kashmirensis W13003 TaxID=1424334 RepID=V8QM00_9BURK|nr:YjiH family protein [Advenella kashmirensis]ETF00996.1 histidine transporter [Advenella kashmirensis W13003]
MTEQTSGTNYSTITKIFILSAIGIFLFFVPITLAGKSTILVDHASGYLIKNLRPIALVLLMLLMVYGVLGPFLNGRFKASTSEKIFTLFKGFGLLLGVAYLFGIAPEWAMQADMLPFLFEKLSLSVGILIPIGALALTFLVGFGLMEFIGVFLEPFMRPVFKTPGTSAIDAVASFVGSYSIGLLITDRVYWSGKYSLREATIIATGFSTVSATFMLVVAKTLGLIDHWNFYFWSTLIVTFAITAICAHLPPIRGLSNDAKNRVDQPKPENRLVEAIEATQRHYDQLPPWHKLFLSDFKDGVNMAAIVAPSILAIGFIGLILAKYTFVFDVIGIVLKPALWLTGFEHMTQYSDALASGLAEMFLPAILLKNTDLSIRYIAAVVSVSSIIFFSGSIPCMLATRIPLNLIRLIVIWIIRTVIGIVLASISLRIGQAFGWI